MVLSGQLNSVGVSGEGRYSLIADYEIPVARNLRDQVFNIILNNRLIAKM